MRFMTVFLIIMMIANFGCRQRQHSGDLAAEYKAPSVFYNKDRNHILSTYYDTKEILDEKLSEESVTYWKLKSRIKNFTSVLQMIEYFADQEDLKPFLNRAALLYESESLFEHAITPEFPRVVLRHDGLLIGITPNPKHPDAFATVEFTQFEPDNTFSYHRLRYGPDGGDFTDRDPSCSGCHGEDARPIWNEYPIWPGAFGSNDDHLAIQRDLKNYLTEGQNFAKFMNARQGVYGKIVFSKYTMEAASTDFFNNLGDMESEARWTKLRPDLLFATTNHIFRLNFKRILAKIKRAGGLRALIGFEAALLRCTNFGTLFENSTGPLPYAKALEQANAELKRSYERVERRFWEVNPDLKPWQKYLKFRHPADESKIPETEALFVDVLRVEELRRLTERQKLAEPLARILMLGAVYKFDVRSFGTSFERGDPFYLESFNTGTAVPFPFVENGRTNYMSEFNYYELLPELVSLKKSLNPNDYRSGWPDSYCTALKNEFDALPQ